MLRLISRNAPRRGKSWFEPHAAGGRQSWDFAIGIVDVQHCCLNEECVLKSTLRGCTVTHHASSLKYSA